MKVQELINALSEMPLDTEVYSIDQSGKFKDLGKITCYSLNCDFELLEFYDCEALPKNGYIVVVG